MSTRKGRLLVVDDNDSNRDIRTRQLRRLGYEVVAAGLLRRWLKKLGG